MTYKVMSEEGPRLLERDMFDGRDSRYRRPSSSAPADRHELDPAGVRDLPNGCPPVEGDQNPVRPAAPGTPR
ncbi:MAG: hypothetical protein R3B96_20420 [Pirellulaceae bacterium]